MIDNPVIITCNGAQIITKPKNGTDFSLEEMQEIVGGYIEIIQLGNNLLMVMNEEGKFHYGVNKAATVLALARKAIFPFDTVHGDVLICNSNQIK